MTDRPIIVIGVGRSGSSIFHEMLSEHAALGWLSELCERHPGRPRWNRHLLRAVGVPAVGNLLRRQWPPSEAYAFWDMRWPGFSVPFRDLEYEDASEAGIERLRRAFAEAIPPERRPLIKITGWPRVGFLRAVWPEATFVHVLRDGRAVANSLLNVPWWWGWRGPENWRFGPLPEPYRARWEDLGRSFEALAAIEWCLVLDAVERWRRELDPDGIIDIRFEDFAADPGAVLTDLCGRLGLEPTGEIEAVTRRRTVRNTNDKWRRQLTPVQRERLTSVCDAHLRRYGYSS